MDNLCINNTNKKPIPLLYHPWDKDLKSIPEIQQLNNSIQRRDELEKYAIAAQNEILRLRQVVRIYAYKDSIVNNLRDVEIKK